jgi:hypothetical protein
MGSIYVSQSVVGRKFEEKKSSVVFVTREIFRKKVVCPLSRKNFRLIISALDSSVSLAMMNYRKSNARSTSNA